MSSRPLPPTGLSGVLLASWRLRCETPLAVRNGLQVEYESQDHHKSRGDRIRFHWRPKDKKPGEDQDEAAVAALHYGYVVEGGRLAARHAVPPSSVRGALRSWTISHLVHPRYRSGMTPPENETPEETDAYLARVKQAQDDPAGGWLTIASLFGQAFESRDEELELSRAGRLRVETDPFEGKGPQSISVNGWLEDEAEPVGPENARRQMTVRNPLDRVTHASRKGGLHQFLEFCAGEEFNLRLKIIDPQDSDLGLLGLWLREMNLGMLRLGALAAIGRGRVAVVEEQSSVCLWLQAGDPLPDWLDGFEPAGDGAAEEPLAGLWREYRLPVAALDRFIINLQTNG